jgi:hypothetical protein
MGVLCPWYRVADWLPVPRFQEGRSLTLLETRNGQPVGSQKLAFARNISMAHASTSTRLSVSSLTGRLRLPTYNACFSFSYPAGLTTCGGSYQRATPNEVLSSKLATSKLPVASFAPTNTRMPMRITFVNGGDWEHLLYNGRSGRRAVAIEVCSCLTLI